MNKEILITLINDKINELEEELNQINDSNAKFFENFFSNNQYSTIESLIGIDYSDILIALLDTNANNDSFEEIEREVKSFSNLINKLNSEGMSVLKTIIEIYIKKDRIRRVYDIVNNQDKKNIIVKKHNEIRKKLITYPIEKLAKSYKITDIDVDNLLKIIIKYPNEMMDNVFFIQVLKDISERKEASEEKFDEYETSTFLKFDSKFREETFTSLLENKYNMPVVYSIFNDIKNHSASVIKKENSKRKSLKNQIKLYKSVLDDLEYLFNKDEVVDFQRVSDKITDDDIRLEFLKLIYQHNISYYKKLEEEEKEVSKNTENHYYALLKKLKITPEEINIKRVMRYNYDLFSEIVDELRNFIKDKELIIIALENSNLEIISNLKNLVITGIISIETLNKYPDLFYINSSEYTSLIQSINVFSKYNFNIANLINNPEVLINNSNLENNLELLEKYDLIGCLKGENDYHYLTSNNLEVLIDKIIELGYEDYLVANLSILNEDNFDRLYVLKAMNYDKLDYSEILNVLRSDNFIINDSFIEDYIPNAVNYYMDRDIKLFDSIDELDEYSQSSRSYNINGVILSKNRVLRNIEEGNSIFDSLLKTSILSHDDIESIIKKNKEYSLVS